MLSPSAFLPLRLAMALGLSLAASHAAQADAIAPAHPLLGTWVLAIPHSECAEHYLFRRNGTSLTRSAQETTEARFSVAAKPSARGYYRFADTVTRSNRRPDCLGNSSSVGQRAELFLRFNSTADAFVMCRDESLRACIGPFRRPPDVQSL